MVGSEGKWEVLIGVQAIPEEGTPYFLKTRRGNEIWSNNKYHTKCAFILLQFFNKIEFRIMDENVIN